MLPFRKNDDDGIAMGEDDPIKRKPDDDGDFGMLDACAEDILHAVKKDDISLLKEALKAFADHIKQEDVEQDNAADQGQV